MRDWLSIGIERAMIALGLSPKPFYVPMGLVNLPDEFEAFGRRPVGGHEVSSLARARNRWGEAELLVSLPDGRYKLAS